MGKKIKKNGKKGRKTRAFKDKGGKKGNERKNEKKGKEEGKAEGP